jgi:hypothetical protein
MNHAIMRSVWLEWSFRKVWDTAGIAWLIVSPNDVDVVTPTLVLDGEDVKQLIEEWKETPPCAGDLRQK